jgi:hypothetical protein
MSEFAEIRSALAELQRSTGRIEGTLGGLTKGFEEFKTDHRKLAGRVLSTELSIAQSRGRNTILGAIGGGLMSVLVTFASRHWK